MNSTWIAEFVWALMIPVVAYGLYRICDRFLGRFTKQIVIRDSSGATYELSVPANAGKREIWKRIDQFYADRGVLNLTPPASSIGNKAAQRRPRAS